MFVTFLTDFGLQDDFVGTCHGVIKRIAPEVADHRHHARDPARSAILQGALVLANTLPYMPEGVHLAVVDPGVGGARRRARAARRRRARLRRAGQRAARPGRGARRRSPRRTSSRIPSTRSSSVSRTFHGRDLFAPAAAHLARGARARRARAAGRSRMRSSGSTLPEPEVGANRIAATVLYVDAFGNVQLNLTREHLERGRRRSPGRASSSRSSARALLRRRGADVRRRAAGRHHPLRGRVPEHRRSRSTAATRRRCSSAGGPGRSDRPRRP